MWPLTSPTTCYSGARNLVIHRAGEDASAPSASLATALHEIHLYGLDSKSDTEPTVKWEQVDANSTAGVDRICVGYTANSEYTVTALLAGLDRFISQESNGSVPLDAETAQMLRESLYASETADTASVTTGTASSILSEQPPPVVGHARRTSSSDLDIFSASGDLTTILAADSSQPQSTEPLHARLPTALKGLLVWKDARDATVVRATYEIDFRPLAMTLGRVRIQTGTTTADDSNSVLRPTVWMGSADAARLYAFYWIEETSELKPLPLEDDVFDFTSPVMAIDVREVSATATEQQQSTYLAVACQDGTVRCIQFSHYDASTQTWSAKEMSQVVVDGPLVCLHFVPGTTNALVGSLCGYVMLQDEHGSPSLVAAELEFHEGAEDSVLAVHGWDDWVAIGTQAGALLLYRRCKDGTYQRAGKWHLPYSVHEICCLGDDKGLLVTTRKTLHWFTLHELPPPNASLAKTRIQHLLDRASLHYWDESPTKPTSSGEMKEGNDKVSPKVLHGEKD